MLRTILSIVVILSVLITSLRAPLLANNWGGGVAEISQEPGDFLAIISMTTYVVPSQASDELAYFSATDLVGRLWNVDVNLTKGEATYAADDGTHRRVQLTPAEVDAFRSGALLASSPERRVQCLAHPVCAGVVGTIIGIAVAGVYFNAACRANAAGHARTATANVDHCKALMAAVAARGDRCEMFLTRVEANLDDCFGGSAVCTVHCDKQ